MTYVATAELVELPAEVLRPIEASSDQRAIERVRRWARFAKLANVRLYQGRRLVWREERRPS